MEGDTTTQAVKNKVAFRTTHEASQQSPKSNVKTATSSDPRRAPRSQPWYYHNGSSWEEVSRQQTPEDPSAGSPSQLIRLRLLTWNIDVMERATELRMASAITYLCSLLTTSPPAVPVVIFLQEMCSSDLGLLKRAKWVQDRFFMTDINERHWGDPYYGTTTLLDRRLPILDVFRVHFKSRFGRDGLFADIASAGLHTEAKQALRLCNTHLDSLALVPPLRPEQMALAGEYLHAEAVRAGVIAGDMNAIQPFDKTLHTDNDLLDAYLALGGEEDGAGGFTWGYQSDETTMKRFGPSRMDKVMFCGQVAVKDLERIGIGAKVDEASREEVSDLCEGRVWITDHYGLSVYLDLLS